MFWAGHGLVCPSVGLAMGSAGHRMLWTRLLWPWAGLDIVWFGHWLGLPWARLGWAGHGLDWVGLANMWAGQGWASHGLRWPWSCLAMMWSGHGLGWPCADLAMVWTGHRWGRQAAGFKTG
jgi:hypothetical protein